MKSLKHLDVSMSYDVIVLNVYVNFTSCLNFAAIFLLAVFLSTSQLTLKNLKPLSTESMKMLFSLDLDLQCWWFLINIRL